MWHLIYLKMFQKAFLYSLQGTTLPLCSSGSLNAWIASSSCLMPTSWISLMSSPRWSAHSRTMRTKCAWCSTRQTRSAPSSWWGSMERWCGLWVKSSTHLRWEGGKKSPFVVFAFFVVVFYNSVFDWRFVTLWELFHSSLVVIKC